MTLIFLHTVNVYISRKNFNSKTKCGYVLINPSAENEHVSIEVFF